VLSVAFFPDSRRVLSLGGERVIRLWDTRAKTELRKIEGRCNEGEALAISPDGKRVLSGDVVLWDLETEAVLHSFEGNKPLHLAFSPDGRRVASSGYDKTVRVWEGDAGEARPAK
jgi:WD40 repeat protein